MNPTDFEYLSTVIKEQSGLVLTPDKLYLLESRLMPIARARGIAGLTELVAALRVSADKQLLNEIVEAMTTNESFFFRDSGMFDRFRDEVLPALIQTRSTSKRLRIWCAAASSGQEPYSIAIILKEAAAALAGWNIEIVGTDISLEILNRARSGVYTQFEVQRGVPTAILLKYFDPDGDNWQIKESLRSMVQYKPFNLLHDLRPLGQFDAIFCRNVLIYFDQETKKKILGSISQMLAPDGVLLLGGAETVLGLCDAFQPSPEQRGIYRLTGAPAVTKPVAPPPRPPAVAPAAPVSNSTASVAPVSSITSPAPASSGTGTSPATGTSQPAMPVTPTTTNVG